MRKILAIIKFREGLTEATSHYLTKSQYVEMAIELPENFECFELRKITSGNKKGSYKLTIKK